MTTENPSDPSMVSQTILKQGRGWIIAEGIVFILLGLVSVDRPYFATFAITQLLGIICIVSGVFVLGGALFNKSEKGHRVWGSISGLLRLIAGLALVIAPGGPLALTLILAAVLVIEGIFSIAAAFKGKGKIRGWFWLLLNGAAALILAFMIYAHLPNSSEWIIGLLFGINLLFSGFSFLLIGLAMNKTD